MHLKQNKNQIVNQLERPDKSFTKAGKKNMKKNPKTYRILNSELRDMYVITYILQNSFFTLQNGFIPFVLFIV